MRQETSCYIYFGKCILVCAIGVVFLEGTSYYSYALVGYKFLIICNQC